MLANEKFQMRISPTEKLMLSFIARRTDRTQAAVLRKFIRDTYRAMKQTQQTTNQEQSNHEQPAAG